MRILIITTPLPTLERPTSLGPLVDQMRSLRELGINIDVLEVKGRTPLKYLRAIWQLRKRLALVGSDFDTDTYVDIVHGHHGYCGWVARSQFMRPVVVSFMGEDALGMPFRSPLYSAYYRIVAWLNRRLAKSVDAVIVKSAEMKEALHFDEAQVIPNGVDTTRFRPLDMLACRTELGWDESEIYVLFGANPDDPRKNFALARETTSLAQEQLGKPITLVPLHGVAHDDVPVYMNASNAMVFTSLLEGSPNVVKEAMACNLPVVSVPVADVPWLFDDAQGYAIREVDASLLAGALADSLLDTQQVIDGTGALVRKNLTLLATAHRVADSYHAILEKR